MSGAYTRIRVPALHITLVPGCLVLLHKNGFYFILLYLSLLLSSE
jgi:hypothetical protein